MKARAQKLAVGVAALLLLLLIAEPLLAQAAPQAPPAQPPPAQPANPPAATPPQNLPDAPSSAQTETKTENKTEPSLNDLGFPTEQTQPDPKMQALQNEIPIRVEILWRPQ